MGYRANTKIGPGEGARYKGRERGKAPFLSFFLAPIPRSPLFLFAQYPTWEPVRRPGISNFGFGHEAYTLETKVFAGSLVKRGCLLETGG